MTPQMRRLADSSHKKEGKKSGRKAEVGRMLITVSVLGSSGPIRFVAREDDLVASIIGIVLKSYAREGRLPVLGSDSNDFVLYSGYDASNALSPWEPIRCNGSRNFLLCKKQGLDVKASTGMSAKVVSKKGKVGWKAWLNKSLSFRISTN
ncbi:hypothetical protein HPP92_009673 [Vanilla planifolia]|uniref:DUF7054 domain-containing protein n=1 Tax=Vanilla planifolia TaxID=51239 RepID=A0A835RJS4_VANPL|nr:hypothetical protein HPP92_009908 [Vanilla planifolia]KAG0487578.1 hypothetical protein HPP92_009673 [Vanilla planifolia]